MELINKPILNITDKVLILESTDLALYFIDYFMKLYKGTPEERLDYVLNYNVWCYDIYVIDVVEEKFGLPQTFNLYDDDFLLSYINEEFDYICGFPFIDYNIKYKNDLHQLYGRLNGYKIPVECWSLTKCLGILSDRGLFELCYDIDFVGRKYLGLEQLNLSKNIVGDKYYYLYKNKTNVL